MATLSRGEWPGPFSGCITLRMILIYYAQVRFSPVTENKGEGFANYIKEEGYLQMQREKWLTWLHSSLEDLA